MMDITHHILIAENVKDEEYIHETEEKKKIKKKC